MGCLPGDLLARNSLMRMAGLRKMRMRMWIMVLRLRDTEERMICRLLRAMLRSLAFCEKALMIGISMLRRLRRC